MSKVLLTIEQVRFIWSLGFASGRVQQASHPNEGVTWEEETIPFESDLARLASANKQLSKKLLAANNACTGLAPIAAQESEGSTGASQ
jgi:hypothetical protein